jgi:hypothetical protein
MKRFMSILFPTMITSAIVMQGTLSIAQMSASIESPSNETIRPFKVHVPKKDLDDLRKLILATRWPDKETVSDQSQGVQLDKLQALMHYWGTGYDWRKAEAKLNALPQFVTHIDGVNIYFVHVRSKEPNAMPLIITHGWPGSIFEMLKIIGPLTNPTAYGGKPEDAFDVVIPSLPGYGFSGKPVTTGWDADHIGRVWAQLMQRLGIYSLCCARWRLGCTHHAIHGTPVCPGADWYSSQFSGNGTLLKLQKPSVADHCQMVLPIKNVQSLMRSGPII